MQSGRYYLRPRRTIFSSYVQGLDLLGTQVRRDLALYRRKDGTAIARTWGVTGKSIEQALQCYAAQERERARSLASP